MQQVGNSVAHQPSAHGSEGEILCGHSSACTVNKNYGFGRQSLDGSLKFFLFLNFILTENTYF